MGRYALHRHTEPLPRLRRRRERPRLLRLRLHRRPPEGNRRVRRCPPLPPRRDHRRLLGGQGLRNLPTQGSRQVGPHLRAHHPPLQRGLGRRLQLGHPVLGNLERAGEPLALAWHARAVLRALPHHGQPPQVVLPRHQGWRLRQLRLRAPRRSRHPAAPQG